LQILESLTVVALLENCIFREVLEKERGCHSGGLEVFFP
jgi:hypothetical protein